MKNLKKLAVRAAAASAVLVGAAGSAMATGIDLSAQVTAAQTDVTTNGIAVMGVVVAVATFAWIRRVLR